MLGLAFCKLYNNMCALGKSADSPKAKPGMKTKAKQANLNFPANFL